MPAQCNIDASWNTVGIHKSNDIFNEIGCSNVWQNHEVCPETDVRLLADVFEKFRSACWEGVQC